MATEWYRRKGWGPKRREEFFTRLRRCRDKSEYVRVQALELVDTRSHRAHLGAIELFDYFLKEWPDNIMLSTVLDGRAECLVRMGDLDQAIETYRRVFECLRGRAIQTHAPVDFGWLVATTPLPKLYDEALSVLEEFPRDKFPIERYRTNAIQALIFDALRQRKKARQHARSALAEAAITHSGMRYHPTFGIVQSSDPKIQKKLHAIAT